MPGRFPSASLISSDLRYQTSGRGKIAAILRHTAELVVGRGHTRPVAERLLHLQRLATPSFGRSRVAAILRHYARVVVSWGEMSIPRFCAGPLNPLPDEIVCRMGGVELSGRAGTVGLRTAREQPECARLAVKVGRGA